MQGRLATPGTQPRVRLVGGGVRSGKSAFALRLARGLGLRRVFIATAQAFDDEMRVRIAAHTAERGAEFETVEAPEALTAALRALGASDARAPEVVVIDCITLWLSNLLLSGRSAAEIDGEVAALCDELGRRRYETVLVTNEVGMGIVPESALGRTFRDLAGLANQRLAAVSDELYWAMLGVVLRLKPEPLTLSHSRSGS